MKKMVVILLAIAVMTAVGCGNKPEEKKDEAAVEAGAAKVVYLSDPVDGSKIDDIKACEYSIVHDNVEYFFNSKKNYEAFKKEPEKYIKK